MTTKQLKKLLEDKLEDRFLVTDGIGYDLTENDLVIAGKDHSEVFILEIIKVYDKE
jgi:hypothetical protein